MHSTQLKRHLIFIQYFSYYDMVFQSIQDATLSSLKLYFNCIDFVICNKNIHRSQVITDREGSNLKIYLLKQLHTCSYNFLENQPNIAFVIQENISTQGEEKLSGWRGDGGIHNFYLNRFIKNQAQKTKMGKYNGESG